MNKSIFAIDPGTLSSAFVRFGSDGQTIYEKGIVPNEQMLDILGLCPTETHALVIEEVRCYGMPVGKETFDTVIWTGRFIQRWHERGGKFHLVGRKEIGLHLCNHPRANDPSVRQALLDRFGAKGTKKNPGKLYGFSSHEWAALAVAVFAHDTIPSEPTPDAWKDLR